MSIHARRAFELFDEFGLTGKDARFIASNGYSLARQVRNGSPQLDEVKLRDLIFRVYSDRKQAVKIWNLITERKVSSALVEKAVRTGKLDAELVSECISVPEPTFVRVRREWTKEDKERTQIFGVVRE